ncbi:MAG: hypothetical protein ACLQHF_16795 [Terracidiphilus sp.]
MVAALNNFADEEAPPMVAAGSSQTVATKDPTVSSFLNGNLPRVDSASRAMAETLQPANTQSAQASVTLAHTAAISEQEASPDAKEESDSGAASVRAPAGRAKPSDSDRPATAKSTHLPAGSPSPNDVATAMVAQFIAPVQPAMMAKTPVSSGAQPATESTANENVCAHPAIAPASPEPRVSESNAALPAPKTESSAQNAVDRSPVPADSIADGTSASHTVIANHSPETAVLSPAMAAVCPVSNSQPDATSKGLFVGAPAEPSTSSAVDNGVLNSFSSVSGAGAVRPQIAAARAAAGSQSGRVNRADNSQLNPAAVEGLHSQLNASTGGSAVVRDPAGAMPSNPGPGPAVETASGTSTAETFTALDGASNSMHATWVHAGAHQAEAGFEDPALGWVSVRAEVNAGGISAVVLPDSAGAAQALGAHMAGLHDYLAEQHSPIESLTLATAQNSGSDTGLGQGAQHEGMQHRGQQQSAEDNPASAQAFSSIPRTPTATAPAQTTHLSSDEIPAVLSGSGARYISVMA